MFSVQIVICLVFASEVTTQDAEGEEEMRQTAVEKGKLQWDLIQAKSKMPRYGTCWQSALGQVEAGCKRLDEDQQARLALALVGCQMDQLGFKRKPRIDSNGEPVPRSYTCPPETPLTECTVGLDEDTNAFTAFTQFFTHTAHICFFLESQRWQESTRMTIDTLLRSSDIVARGLNISTRMQEKLISSQEELLHRGANLSKSLESSSAGVQRLFDEFRASTESQRLLVRDTIAQVVELRAFIVDQVGLLYSYIFYVAALIVATLLTSTKRSSGARIWLYFILTLNVVAERLFLYYVDSELVHVYGAKEISDLIYLWCWRCRQSALGIGALVFVWKILTYRDLHTLNSAILKEIQLQNADLKTQLSRLSSHSGPDTTPKEANVVSATPTKSFITKDLAKSGHHLTRDSLAEQSRTLTKESHIDSIFSNSTLRHSGMPDSTHDSTFIPNDDDDDDTESLSDDDTTSWSSSGRSSRVSHPPDHSSFSLFPPRASSATSSMGSSFASSASAMASSLGSAVGSTLSSLMDELRSLSPPGVKNDPGKRQAYNFRPRNRTSLFNGPSQPTSAVGAALKRGVPQAQALQDETPEEFGAEVKRMLGVTRRNARKVKRVVASAATNEKGLDHSNNTTMGFYSSDDE